ncbi:SGNH hydrolase domain-containing protein [Microbulbifer epialgicus]|uniref:SGNH hydrolase domain-containing protein n=1 Tax=Microbulbifer epialgicus TaxID=393907 RepID=A0ABV4NZ75_9GAMM
MTAIVAHLVAVGGRAVLPRLSTIALPARITRSRLHVAGYGRYFGAFLAGFERWLEEKERNGIVAAKSACAPILGVARLEKGAPHGCNNFNSEVMEMLEQRSDIGTVVLVTRWALVVEGSRSPGESGPPAVMGIAKGAGESLKREGGSARNFN